MKLPARLRCRGGASFGGGSKLKQNIKEHCSNTVKGIFWGVLDFLKYMLITGIVAFLITRLLFPIAVIPTSSMENEIPANSFVVCSKLSYWGSRSPQRGDVILFYRSDKTTDGKLYTKRIVGLPGDTVTIKNGETYINGILFPEPWLKEEPEKLDFGPYEIPSGQYFCMGDNRNHSYDCRYWEEHFIEESNIVAKCNIVLSYQKISLIDDHH